LQLAPLGTLLRQNIRKSVLRAFRTDPIQLEYDSKQGIPVVNYGERCGSYVGRQVNPLTVALYACRQLGLESTAGPILLPRLRQAEGSQYVERAIRWLDSSQLDCGRFSVWEYAFPWPSLNLQPPWRSALAEAFGALLLLVVGKAEEARRHLEAMLTDYRQGGVAYVGRDSLWFLEFACEQRPLVLNCMLHCLLILRECSLRLGDPALREGFELGCRTLKRDLGLFDATFYTCYDSRRNPADEKYHTLHVELLRMLIEKTGDRSFSPWLARWSQYGRTYPFLEPFIFVRHMIRSKGSPFI